LRVASLSLDRPIRGLDGAALDALIAALGEGAISADVRREALARFVHLPAPDIQPGRYWKVDLAKANYDDVVPFTLEPPDTAPAPIAGIEPAWSFVQIDSHAVTPAHAPRAEERFGVWSFAEVMRDGDPDVRARFERAFRSALAFEREKFASLALAFQTGGAFLYVAKGVRLEAPLALTYVARHAALFPYTLVVVDEGARASILQRIVCEGENPFVSAVVEIVAAPSSRVDFCSLAEPAAGRIFATRRARVDRDASVAYSLADLGGDLFVDSTRAALEERGASAEVAGLFFSGGAQHAALETQVDHAVGDTRSETVVRGAATDRGQGRYVGNIRIHPHAHGSDASLRDDSLLLSKNAHIDSIPALEIAANDVKAFHGATVGAIDEEEIFYAQSRGITRAEAERMIALGFFEPALDRFPAAVREHVRAALERKLPVSAS
jgi:Fe-S cluster assembly protein SufD